MNNKMKPKYSMEYIYENKVAIEIKDREKCFKVVRELYKGIKDIGYILEPSDPILDVNNYSKDKPYLVLLNSDILVCDVYIGFCSKHIVEEDNYIIIGVNDIEI